MADEFYRKQEIYVRHGKGFRQYPFSIVQLVSSDGTIVGSGMAPDGDAVNTYELLVSEYDVAQDVEPIFDPQFLKDNKLATGIMENRGQWY